MIKCPKEFYKLLQDNEDFIKSLKELKDNELSMEVEWTGGSYNITIHNLKWSGGSYGIRHYPNLHPKEYYENELKESRNKADMIKTELDKNKCILSKKCLLGDNKNNNNNKSDNKKYTDYDLEQVYRDIDYQEVFLGMKQQSSYIRFHAGVDDTPYNTRLEHNNKFVQNVIDAINNNIKEYRGIKFCTDDIILY